MTFRHVFPWSSVLIAIFPSKPAQINNARDLSRALSLSSNPLFSLEQHKYDIENAVERSSEHKNKWSGWQDLNLRHLAPKASALAKLSYTPIRKAGEILPTSKLRIYDLV